MYDVLCHQTVWGVRSEWAHQSTQCPNLVSVLSSFFEREDGTCLIAGAYDGDVAYVVVEAVLSLIIKSQHPVVSLAWLYH